jgi:hypothetical protein
MGIYTYRNPRATRGATRINTAEEFGGDDIRSSRYAAPRRTASLNTSLK